jgi:hypothetical protein
LSSWRESGGAVSIEDEGLGDRLHERDEFERIVDAFVVGLRHHGFDELDLVSLPGIVGADKAIAGADEVERRRGVEVPVAFAVDDGPDAGERARERVTVEGNVRILADRHAAVGTRQVRLSLMIAQSCMPCSGRVDAR